MPRGKKEPAKDKKTAEPTLSLSVIVPVRSNAANLGLLLESLGKVRKPFEKE